VRLVLAATALLALVAGAANGGPNPSSELVYTAARGDQGAELFAIGRDGVAGARRLTRTFDAEDAPSWSPRGDRIAYGRGVPTCHAGQCNGLLEADIWLLNVGGTARRLTRGRAADLVDTSPSWSPDGRRIAFVRRACCDDSDADGVYVVGVDGTGLTRLTSERAVAVAWGPSGTSLAIAREGAPPFVWDAASGETRPLVTSGLPVSARVADLAWSPDGGRVALATSGGLYVVYLRRAIRVGPRRAITGVDWSRDGRELAFAASDLFLMRPNGSRLRRLTRTGAHEAAVSWRP
jgi:Tol biopolymer transport system component